MHEAFSRGGAGAARVFLDPDVVIDATHRVDGALYELRHAKVTRWTIYENPLVALEALGLRE